MIRKSVTISNMAISNEKLNGRKPSILSLLGRLSILTNTYDAVNPCKDSSMFTKLTGTAVRGSFQRKHLKDKQRSHLFWRWRPWISWKQWKSKSSGNKKSWCGNKLTFGFICKTKSLGRIDPWADSTLLVLGHRWTYDQLERKGCGLSWATLVLDLSWSVLSAEDNLQCQVAGVREADHPSERMW